MSSDPIGGILAGAAGLPAAQSARSQGATAQQLARLQEQQRAAKMQADRAAGIAEPDAKDTELQDREADGRQTWRRGAPNANIPLEPAPESISPSKSQIDLIG